MAATGVPSADFGHCSAIPDAVAALWNLRRGTRRAQHSPRYYSANSGRPDSTSSHVWPRTHLLLGKGSGDATCPSKRDTQHMQLESRTSPLEGSGTSTCLPDLLMCTPALRPGGGGPGPPRAPPPLEHAGPGPTGPTECHIWRTEHPTATTTPPAGVGRTPARSPRGRTMPRTTTTPDVIPHSVLPTVLDYCIPTARGETATSAIPYTCTRPS